MEWCSYGPVSQITGGSTKYGMDTSCCRAKTLVEYFGDHFLLENFLLYVKTHWLLCFLFCSLQAASCQLVSKLRFQVLVLSQDMPHKRGVIYASKVHLKDTT